MKKMAYQRNIKTELELARSKNLPVLILISPKLNKIERIEIEGFFIGCNIFKIIDADVDTSKNESEITAQVEDILKSAMGVLDFEVINDAFQFQREYRKDRVPHDLFTVVANRPYLIQMRSFFSTQV